MFGIYGYYFENNIVQDGLVEGREGGICVGQVINNVYCIFFEFFGWKGFFSFGFYRLLYLFYYSILLFFNLFFVRLSLDISFIRVGSMFYYFSFFVVFSLGFGVLEEFREYLNEYIFFLVVFLLSIMYFLFGIYLVRRFRLGKRRMFYSCF